MGRSPSPGLSGTIGRSYWERESERRIIERDSGVQEGEGSDVAEEDLNKLMTEIGAKMDMGPQD